MSAMRTAVTAVSFLLSVFHCQHAEAKPSIPSDVYDLPELVAVQNRTYFLTHGLTAQVGALPTDAFNKAVTVGGSYTTYFRDYLGWEIINFNYAFNHETDLKKDLFRNFRAEVVNVGFGGVLDYVDYYVTTGLHYTPLYNKSLLFNRKVVRSETSLVVGAGGAKFHATGWRPVLSVGALFRFFTSANKSIVFDIREHGYFEQDRGIQGLFAISVGYTWQLGKAPHPPPEIEK